MDETHKAMRDIFTKPQEAEDEPFTMPATGEGSMVKASGPAKEGNKEVLTEQTLKDYYDIKQEIKRLEALEDQYRTKLLRFNPTGARDVFQAGAFTVIWKPRKGAVKVDWEHYCRETIGNEGVEELLDTKKLVLEGKVESPFIEVGKESMVVEVVRKA